MKYHQNTYSTEQQNQHNLVTFIKAIGILSIAYLAYNKRGQINQGLHTAKDSCNKLVEPLAEGIKKTTHNVQDFLHHKTEDASSAVSNFGSQIENKYAQLQGDAKDTYKNQLISLRDKLDKLIDKAETNMNNSNLNNTFGSNNKDMSDKKNADDANNIRDLNHLGKKDTFNKEHTSH